MKTINYFRKWVFREPFTVERLQDSKSDDARWDQGKVFGFVYHPGNHYSKLSEKYLNAFLYESTLNPSTFPSLQNLKKIITGMAAELMHGDHRVAGNVTIGRNPRASFLH